MTYNDEEKIPAPPTLARIIHRPLILDDFRDIPADTKVRMWSHKRFHEELMWYEHARTDGRGLVGRYWSDESGWSDEDRHIVEHENVLCTSRSLEPLWSCPPIRWSLGAQSDDEEANDEDDGSDVSES
jgi:hypothetical protein